MNHDERPILVTGASGYVGSRLVPALLERGYRVRATARSEAKLRARPWAGHEGVEIVAADLEDETDAARCLSGCRAAYFLVHSMMARDLPYRERDRRIAENVARGAEQAGLERIVYLGGLGESGADLSEHLRSRREVEEVLARGRTPVVVLRAAMILGSGSASFEILRYLVQRLPVMVTPRWVDTPCQPIAIRDVLRYLVQSLDLDAGRGLALSIGGADVLTYRELMQRMAEALGLPRRLILPVPVLTPRLSSLWIQLVTPLPQNIARPLAEGLRNPVVCEDDEAQRRMPGALLDATAALEQALAELERGDVGSHWTSAGVMPGDPEWAGGAVCEDRRSIDSAASPAALISAACRLGGANGYFQGSFLWRLRGSLDRLAGGPGLRRGRHHPERLAVGDALDFWRVVALDPGRRLLLHAEMRLPGVATLEFAAEPLANGGSRLVQTARFRPRGLTGLAYWYALLPLHHFVFRGLIRGLEASARERAAGARHGLSEPHDGSTDHLLVHEKRIP